MIRSRSGRSSKVRSRAGVADLSTACLRCILAAMFPRDQKAEEDVQSAEAESHEGVAAGREKERERAEKDEACAHRGEERDRECPAGDDSGTVEQEPECGHESGQVETGKGDGEENRYGDARQKAECEF